MAQVRLWRSEDNLQASVLSSHHVGPGDQTRDVRASGRRLYLLSHLTSPLPGVLIHRDRPVGR